MVGTAEQKTGWVGWIYFAGVIMIISGLMGIVAGLAAVFNQDWIVYNGDSALLLDIGGWGWLNLIIGGIILFSGFGVFSGNVWARSVGVIMAGLSMIANFVSMSVYPFWSIAIMVVDALVIWALIVHGDELD